jgi:hypothetical protein
VADQSASLANLEHAMAELESYVALPVVTRRGKAGLIQAFEATSPREALIAGVQLHLITNEESDAWSQMLRDRNLSSHTYNAALADEIVDRLLGSYLPCFRATIERTRKSISG